TGLPIDPGTTAPTTIEAEGPVTVDAATEGALWTASLAAAVAKASEEKEPDPPSPADVGAMQKPQPGAALADLALKMVGNQQFSSAASLVLGVVSMIQGTEESEPDGPKPSIAASGDVSLNLITQQNTFAFINDRGTVTTNDAPVIVRAEDESN